LRNKNYFKKFFCEIKGRTFSCDKMATAKIVEAVPTSFKGKYIFIVCTGAAGFFTKMQVKNCKSRIASQELQVKNCKSRIAKKSFRQFGHFFLAAKNE
jgi:hypothetical protein